MPRTRPQEDSLSSIMSTIEDLKNGHIVSVMYCRYNNLVMNPPHIIIFSNQPCPIEMVSVDRWKYYEIIKSTLDLEQIKVKK